MLRKNVEPTQSYFKIKLILFVGFREVNQAKPISNLFQPKNFLGISKNKMEISYTKNSPVIDHERCTLCGLWVDVCPYHALSISSKVEVSVDDCFGCGLCQSRCPVKAIGGVLFE